jgi:hypothetical protein
VNSDILNLVGTESEICGSLGLEALRLGRHSHREDGAKVGECKVTRMWIAGLWLMGAPNACFVYAEATGVVYKRERLPDWKRLAMVWQDRSGDGAQRAIEPVGMEGDPLEKILSGVDLTSVVDEDRDAIVYFLLGRTAGASYDLTLGRGCTLRRSVEDALLEIAGSLAATRDDVRQYLDVWRGA